MKIIQRYHISHTQFPLLLTFTLLWFTIHEPLWIHHKSQFFNELGPQSCDLHKSYLAHFLLRETRRPDRPRVRNSFPQVKRGSGNCFVCLWIFVVVVSLESKPLLWRVFWEYWDYFKIVKFFLFVTETKMNALGRFSHADLMGFLAVKAMNVWLSLQTQPLEFLTFLQFIKITSYISFTVYCPSGFYSKWADLFLIQNLFWFHLALCL